MEDPTPDGSDVTEASFRFQQGVPVLAGATIPVTIRAKILCSGGQSWNFTCSQKDGEDARLEGT